MKYCFLIVSMLFGLSCDKAYGQDRVWTLRQCIEYAAANNLQLKQKRLSVAQAGVDIEAKRGVLFPSLSFATNQNGSWRPYSQQYVNLMNGSMSATTSTLNYNGSYGLQANWTVWNGGRNHKQLELSRLQKRQLEVDEETTRLSIEEQIMQLYVQILYQTEAVRVNSEILESTRVQYKRAQAMYDAGTMSRADLTQTMAQVSQEEYNVVSAQTQLDDFKMQLRQLLELDDSTPFEVDAGSIDAEMQSSALPTVDEVYRAAESHRPELLSRRMAIDAADMEIGIARSGYLPTVSLSAAVNTSASSGLEQNWAKQMKTNLSNSVGLTVSVPIFDNAQNRTSVARARLDKESAQLALSEEQRKLRNTIETYWLNATKAQKQYEYAQTNAASMKTGYDLVQEQFAVGLKDIASLITAKNNLVQAEQQLLQTKYTAVLNRMMLRLYEFLSF